MLRAHLLLKISAGGITQSRDMGAQSFDPTARGLFTCIITGKLKTFLLPLLA
jgi:hypothetical protein